MTDIFHEVDEDLARDKAEKLWKRYQVPIFVAAFLIVAATGAYNYYETNRQRAAESANARYEAATLLARSGKNEEAVAAFQALAKDAPRGYAALARLRGAEALAAIDKPKAIAALAALGEDAGADKTLQEVALLRAALLTLELGDRQKLERALGPLMTSDGPFRYSAQEWTALDALQDGDYDEAERVFNLIGADREAPQSMRQRAAAYRGLLHAARGAKKTEGGGGVTVTPVIEPAP